MQSLKKMPSMKPPETPAAAAAAKEAKPRGKLRLLTLRPCR
jgi:hypothetical protein